MTPPRNPQGHVDEATQRNQDREKRKRRLESSPAGRRFVERIQETGRRDGYIGSDGVSRLSGEAGTVKRFVFSLTEAEAEALIHLTECLTELGYAKRGSLGARADRATNKLDEQLANQERPWERCPNCDGSGWVEDE